MEISTAWLTNMENAHDFIDFVHYDLSAGCPRINDQMPNLSVTCQKVSEQYIDSVKRQLSEKVLFNNAQTLALYDAIKMSTISNMVVDHLYDAYFLFYCQALYWHHYYNTSYNIGDNTR